MSGARVIAEALIAQHQVVVRLQIFRVDSQHLVELLDRFRELPLQEEDAAELIEHDAIARIEIATPYAGAATPRRSGRRFSS